MSVTVLRLEVGQIDKGRALKAGETQQDVAQSLQVSHVLY